MIKRKVILASMSPRRKKLFEQIGLDFEVMDSEVEEKLDRNYPVVEYAETLALQKARAVLKKCKSKEPLIIGADTIVSVRGLIMGKPDDEEQAIEMLRYLSGKTHTVVTAVAMLDPKIKREEVQHKKTTVTFRKISEEEIKEYVKSGSPFDKAGAYGIQDDYGAVFVSRIDGCYYNVVGLPLEMTYTMLKSRDF